MNPVYAVMESAHRWKILAAGSLVLTLLGTMMIFAYGWSHTLARLWLFAGIALTLFFLLSWFLEWYRAVDQDLAPATPAGSSKDDRP